MIVYDVDADTTREVTKAEAGAGMLRYARRFPAGSAVRGETERQALAVMPAPRQRKAHRGGLGAGSPAHRDAIIAAVAAVNAKLSPQAARRG